LLNLCCRLDSQMKEGIGRIALKPEAIRSRRLLVG
jgi:hypothetical protein